MHKRPKHHTLRITILTAAGIALAAGATAFASAAPSQAPSHGGKSEPKPTIVLVHGAWSGPSSWSKQIKSLQAAGYPVTAPPTAMRSLNDDSDYLRSYLKTIKGPVVLVGQSYGGTVITNAATGNTNVKALVYISAFAPDKGETVKELTSKFPGTHITTDPNPDAIPTALNPVPFSLTSGAGGADLYAKADQYRDLFLSNRLSSKDSAVLAAEQSPINAHTLDEPSGDPAWKTIPSWYLVSKQDHLLPPAAERFMAARAHSHTVEANAPHAAQVTDPATVTKLIVQAANTAR